MTTLPSFVELMSSLGLDQAATPAPERSTSSSPRSSPSSSPRMPSVTPPSPTKSRSSPSLRDAGAPRNRLARYSPYSPVFNYLHGVGAFLLYHHHLRIMSVRLCELIPPHHIHRRRPVLASGMETI
ncbi:hypothetical protein B0H10DRAFT_2209090 [Mycena sp. CBHHK59/15]|nr:hypothetical protein B0H10DRAFT_2209090 [Mycena sp. CBHHK59/15]